MYIVIKSTTKKDIYSLFTFIPLYKVCTFGHKRAPCYSVGNHTIKIYSHASTPERWKNVETLSSRSVSVYTLHLMIILLLKSNQLKNRLVDITAQEKKSQFINRIEQKCCKSHHLSRKCMIVRLTHPKVI